MSNQPIQFKPCFYNS